MSAASHSEATASIVGGGPAGLMAAEVLAGNGVAVTLFDHKPSPGHKFLLAGRGGLNITHSEPIEQLLDRYGTRRARLERALRDFTPSDLQSWCADLGEQTFVGSSGRVFPASFRSTPLLRSWLGRLTDLGVEFQSRRWEGWGTDKNAGQLLFSDRSGEQILVDSDVTVFALGGASRPRVGSDGGWVEHFTARGIQVEELRPTNCGVRVGWTSLMIDRFAGIPLKNVAVSLGGATIRGDVVVTESGLEGGPIYAHSSAVRSEIDADGRCILGIDLQPDLSFNQLWERLEKKRRPKDSLSTLLRRAGFDPVAVALMREVMANDLPTSEMGLASLAKLVPVLTSSLMSIDRAISTAGGVSFDEIDEYFMLQQIPGTFIAGEMIDWEAPTGGYLLQASFSTGAAAGNGAARWLRNRQ